MPDEEQSKLTRFNEFALPGLGVGQEAASALLPPGMNKYVSNRLGYVEHGLNFFEHLQQSESRDNSAHGEAFVRVGADATKDALLAASLGGLGGLAVSTGVTLCAKSEKEVGKLAKQHSERVQPHLDELENKRKTTGLTFFEEVARRDLRRSTQQMTNTHHFTKGCKKLDSAHQEVASALIQLGRR